MRCIHCLSLSTVKNGYNEKGIQRYKCNDCGKRYCAKGFFARFRYHPKIIITAVRWRMKRWSCRETADEVREVLRTSVNHVIIWSWCMKFISLLMLWVSLIDTNYENIWHVDEKFIKVRGSKDKFDYLWVVIDKKNKILSVHVSNARSGDNAKIVLRKARTNDNPEIIVTDGLQGYKKACKIFGRKVRHVIAHFKAEPVNHKGKLIMLSNNRIERVNSDIDLFLHVFRGV